MKTIEDELSRVRGEILKLRHEEDVLVRLKAKILGAPIDVTTPETPRRKARSASIKPVVLDLIRNAGQKGMSSAEVALSVKERVPDVAKDTVGSTLSRLKSEGAFVYEQERYYEKQFAPSRMAFGHVKIVPPPVSVN